MIVALGFISRLEACGDRGTVLKAYFGQPLYCSSTISKNWPISTIVAVDITVKTIAIV